MDRRAEVLELVRRWDEDERLTVSERDCRLLDLRLD